MNHWQQHSLRSGGICKRGHHSNGACSLMHTRGSGVFCQKSSLGVPDGSPNVLCNSGGQQKSVVAPDVANLRSAVTALQPLSTVSRVIPKHLCPNSLLAAQYILLQSVCNYWSSRQTQCARTKPKCCKEHRRVEFGPMHVVVGLECISESVNQIMARGARGVHDYITVPGIGLQPTDRWRTGKPTRYFQGLC